MAHVTPACIAQYRPVALAARHDGWTELRQYRFLFALAETGKVSVACREAGLSRRAAYRLRAHPLGGPFARAWDAALEHCHAELWRTLDRDERTRPDRSIMLLLPLLQPGKYGRA